MPDPEQIIADPTPPIDETPVETETAEALPDEEAAVTEAAAAQRQMWDEVCPELSGVYDKLSPDRREGILLARLAAQPPAKPAKEPDPTGQGSTDGSTPAGAQPPRVPPPPDMEKISADISAGMTDGDPALIAAAIRQVYDHSIAVGQLVERVLTQQDGRISAIENEAVVPARFARALPKVAGATEVDVPAAQEYLRTGSASSVEAALKLAVFDRTASANTPVGENARRKAAGIAATRLSGGGKPGAPKVRMPRTQQEWADLYRAEEKRSG